MAWPFTGNINGTVTSQSQNQPMIVENFLIVNKTGGAAVFNVYKITIGAAQISMSPLNKSLSAGEVYESIRPFVMLATELIKIQSAASIDYDFNISNTQAPEVGI